MCVIVLCMYLCLIKEFRSIVVCVFVCVLKRLGRARVSCVNTKFCVALSSRYGNQVCNAVYSVCVCVCSSLKTFFYILQ